MNQSQHKSQDKPQHNPQHKPKIVVIGDIMVDIDLHCRADRICQEGPWPVMVVERQERRMGGAGNVAEMLIELDCRVVLCGIVGRDCHELPARGTTTGYEASAGRGLTTQKIRMCVDGKQVGPRIDADLIEEPSAEMVLYWKSVIEGFQPDAIIVCDHGKGVITGEVMTMISSFQIPIFIDPIKTTPWSKNLLSTPLAIVASEEEMPQWSLQFIQECTISKKAEGGLTWTDGFMGAESLPSACRDLIDPLGAGDQFISALAYQRCLGIPWQYAIRWANVAAGLQCERRGCVPVTIERIETRIFASNPGLLTNLANHIGEVVHISDVLATLLLDWEDETGPLIGWGVFQEPHG